MTQKEFNDKWANVNTDELSEEEFLKFKNDCFELYETTGFSKNFHSPYDDDGEHNGKPFKVLRRATTEECDLEAMPIWVVEFKDENEPCYCYPEEICKIEEKKNYQKKPKQNFVILLNSLTGGYTTHKVTAIDKTDALRILAEKLHKTQNEHLCLYTKDLYNPNDITSGWRLVDTGKRTIWIYLYGSEIYTEEEYNKIPIDEIVISNPAILSKPFILKLPKNTRYYLFDKEYTGGQRPKPRYLYKEICFKHKGMDFWVSQYNDKSSMLNSKSTKEDHFRNVQNYNEQLKEEEYSFEYRPAPAPKPENLLINYASAYLFPKAMSDLLSKEISGVITSGEKNFKKMFLDKYGDTDNPDLRKLCDNIALVSGNIDNLVWLFERLTGLTKPT